MKLSRQQVILLVMCWAGLSLPAVAADSTLTLVVAGEAFDGPPQFSVSFAGQPVGQGLVAAALDTRSGQHLAALSDRTAYVQSFTYALPEAAFRPDGAVAVHLINGLTNGGAAGSRTLFVGAVLVNGRAVTASGLRLGDGGQASPTPALVGEFAGLTNGAEALVAAAPVGGWPQPVSVDPVTTGAIEKPVPQVTQAAARCDLDEIYNVIGFNENSNALTDELEQRLDQVAHDIGSRVCAVTITGYSSKQGALDASALFAVERAQNALTYLKERGVQFRTATATGVGATDRFGPDFRANRRVVIAVRP